jgi:ABC-type transporter Mla subunit MlaD
MARRLAWSDVRGGLLAILAIVVVSVGVLKFARVGALRGDTIRLFALVGQARGILKGSEVWLSGQKIGKVVDIQFRSPSVADSTSRLLLVLDVMEKYRGLMHRDAEAQIKTGGSVIGAAVVYLTPGTVAAPALRDNDTLRTRAQMDLEATTTGFAAVTRELPPLMKNVKELKQALEETNGTLGAVMNEGRSERGQLSSTAQRIGRLRDKVASRRGTVGLVMSGELGQRASRVLARTDSIRTLMSSPSTSFGRFRRDSTLLAEVSDIRNELTIVRTLLAEPRGTAGRVMQDSAVASALGDAQREMGLLVADMKKHPLRYNPF